MEPAQEQSYAEMILSFLAEGGEDYVSGTALCDKLGLSRTAVWKHVEQLRRVGYRIDAQSTKGYRLLEVPDRLTALEMGPLLSTLDFGKNWFAFDSLESTNTKAFQLAQDDQPHGTVVIAEQQTRGKGRRGRTWISPPGKNVALSVILRPDIPPGRAPELTLVAAVALAETIAECDVEPRIKWPNDVQISGKKVAGILTELSADVERVHFVVLGIGVNLNSAPGDFPEDVAAISTSIATDRKSPVHRALFVAALLARLEHWFELWAAEGFAPVREAWRKWAAHLGQEVLVKSESRELRGVAEDIDESGALLVRVGDRLERVLSGDVEQVRTRVPSV